MKWVMPDVEPKGDLESSKTAEIKAVPLPICNLSACFLMIENESGKLMISRYGLVETRVLLIPVGNGVVSGLVWLRPCCGLATRQKLPRTHTYIPAHCVAAEQTEN